MKVALKSGQQLSVKAGTNLYAELAARLAGGYVQPTHVAIAASAAGELDLAVEYVRQAFEIRDPMLMVARHWPDFGRLREDPRFKEILARMGLY